VLGVVDGAEGGAHLRCPRRDRPRPRTFFEKLVSPENIGKAVKAPIARRPVVRVEREDDCLALDGRLDAIQADLIWVKTVARGPGVMRKAARRPNPAEELRQAGRSQ
jgi:hypothetical protein